MRRVIQIVIVALAVFCSGRAALAMGGIPALDPGPYIYVPNFGDSTIGIISSPGGEKITNMLSIGNPISAAVRGDEAFAYIFNGTNVSVVNTGESTLVIPDAFTFYTTTDASVVATISAGTNPVAGVVSPDGRLLYVVNQGSNDVSIIDTATNISTGTIAVGNSPFLTAISRDGSRLYVANQADNTVSIINTSTKAVVGTVTVGSTPAGLAVSNDGSQVYVANSGGNTVSVIDAATQAVNSIIVGTHPTAVTFSPDGTQAYVTNQADNTSSIVDTATQTVTDTVSLGAGASPTGVAIDPTTGPVYYFDRGLNGYSIQVTGLFGPTVIGPISIGTQPQYPAVCSNGNALLTTGNTFIARTPGALQCTGPNGAIFDGGTLQIAGSYYAIYTPIQILSAGGTIDTNGHDLVVGTTISGDGGLTKTGLGTLTFAFPATYLGPTTINAGTIGVFLSDLLPTAGTFTIASGAMLDINGTTQTIGGLGGAGTVNIDAATLTVGGNNENTNFSGQLTGTLGNLIKEGTGQLILGGTSSYSGATTVNNGLLTVNGDISSSSGVTVNSGGTVGGNGTFPSIALGSGASAAPGNSIGTMHVTGNIGFNGGSTYQVEVTSTANDSDKIIATGTATLDPGAQVVVTAATGSYAASTQYTILTAASVSGTFNPAVTTNFAFLTASLSYDPTNVYLTLLNPGASGGGGAVDFCSVAASANQCNTARAVQAGGPGNGLYDAILTQTAAGARQAFDALSGEIYAGLGGALLEDSRYMREALLGRMRAAGYDNAPAGLVPLAFGGPQAMPLGLAYASDDKPVRQNAAQDAPWLGRVMAARDAALAPRPVFWAQSFGAWGEFAGDGNAADMSRRLEGAFFGADRRFGNWQLGAATGYSHADVNIGARASSATVENYYLAGYAAASLDAFNWRSGVAQTWHTIDVSRSIVFPGFAESAQSSFDGATTQVFGELGYSVPVGSAAFEPFGGLAYVWLHLDGFAERGGLAALQSAGENEGIGYSTLGLRGAALYAPDAKAKIIPHFSLAWQHALSQVTPSANVAFVATAQGFDVFGAPVGRDAALVEAGLDLRLDRDIDFEVSYTGRLGSGTDDNAVKGRLTWRLN